MSNHRLGDLGILVWGGRLMPDNAEIIGALRAPASRGDQHVIRLRRAGDPLSLREEPPHVAAEPWPTTPNYGVLREWMARHVEGQRES